MFEAVFKDTLKDLKPDTLPLLDAAALMGAAKLVKVLERSMPLFRRMQRMRDDESWDADVAAIIARKYLKALGDLQLGDGVMLLAGWWFYKDGRPTPHNMIFHVERTGETEYRFAT